MSAEEGTIFDLTNGTGGVSKTIIRCGKEDEQEVRPLNGAVCFVRCTMQQPFGTGQEQFHFTLGQSPVIAALHLGVASMCRGELAQLRCTADYAYGPVGRPPNIAGNTALTLLVELLRWEGEVDLSPNSDRALTMYTLNCGTGDQLGSVVGPVRVTVDAIGAELDGRTFLNRQFDFVLGGQQQQLPPQSQLPNSVVRILRRMRLGERCRCTVKGSDASLSLGQGQHTGPLAEQLAVEFVLTLAHFEALPQAQSVTWRKPPAQKQVAETGAPYRRILKKPRSERDEQAKSRILVNAGTFENMVNESTVFADRTEFIRALLNNGMNQSYLFALPSGCGKSMVLSMLRLFVDDEGDPENSVFKNTYDKGRRFDVMRDDKFWRDHHCRYPTVFIDFNEVCNETADAVKTQIGLLLQNLFSERSQLYEWLQTHRNGTEIERADLAKFEQYFKGSVDYIKWKDALSLLSRLLNARSKQMGHNKKVVIIVDNYDKPMLGFDFGDGDPGSAATKQEHVELRQICKLVRHFVRDCLLTLKDVKMVLIAGTYTFGCGAQNIQTTSMERDLKVTEGMNLSRFFGFAQEEFEELCDSYTIDQKTRQSAKYFYNGTTVSSTPLYSTWSLMQMLENSTLGGNDEIQVYFKPPRFFGHFHKLFTNKVLAKCVVELFENGEYKLKPKEFTTNDMLDLLSSANARQDSPLGKNTPELFMRFLNASGILIRKGNSLEVANEECRLILTELIVANWYQPRYSFSTENLDEITHELCRIALGEHNDDGQALAEQISNFLSETFDEDQAEDRNEQFLQTFIGMAVLRMRGWSRLALDKQMGKRAGAGDNYKKRPDVVVSSRRRQFALCAELKWDSSDEPFYQIATKGCYLTGSGVMNDECGAELLATAIGISVWTGKDGERDRVVVKLEQMKRTTNDATVADLMKRFQEHLKKKYRIEKIPKNG